MHLRGLTLTALLLAAAPLAAQRPPAPPVAPPPPAAQTADTLDDYLARWQQSMEQVQALSATLKRTQKDTVTDSELHFTGYTKYLKVGNGPTSQNLALLEMTQEGKKEFSERFVCSGAFLYQFNPGQKEIIAHELPKPKPGQVADDNLLSFLFGMKKDEAKARYGLKLENKVSNDYVYVDVEPRNAGDKADFKRAQIVLFKSTMLPRRLWFEQVNGAETTWDVLQINPNDRSIDRREFDEPTAPPGWKVVRAAKDVESPPRVARPSGGN